uniref:hypothetical protein n=1 Tax=uncultured Sphingomonas sp. TaxID=158754 RepID=UPI0035CAD734
MTSTRRHVPRSEAQKTADAIYLAEVEPYGSPRKVWVADGHVFVEGHDGKIVSMTPEVAINLGRTISEAGAESLINRVLETSADAASQTTRGA